MSFFKSAVITSTALPVWELYVLVRQRRSFLHTDVPALFKDSITQEEFGKSQAYGREKASFSIVSTIFSSVIGVVKLVTRFASKMYYATAAASGFTVGSFSHCLLYGIADDILQSCISLPFEYYSNFVVEERHGFNKLTHKEFLLDTLKSLALRVTLLHPITTYLIQFVVRRFGDRFPLYFFGLSSAFLLLFTTLYPTFIQPMFNKFTPLDTEGELYGKIAAIAKKMNYPLKRVYVVDGSRRSAHSNAYLYGFWKHKQIVLYDTLLDQTKGHDDWVIAVLCHELGHWKHGHTLYMLGIMLLQLLGISYGAQTVLFNAELYCQFGFEKPDPVVGFELFSTIFLEPIMTVAGYIISYVSRCFEFQADRMAVSEGYAVPLKESLMLLAKENKSCLTPDPLYAALHNSHPGVIERVEAIDRLAQKSE